MLRKLPMRIQSLLMKDGHTVRFLRSNHLGLASHRCSERRWAGCLCSLQMTKRILKKSWKIWSEKMGTSFSNFNSRILSICLSLWISLDHMVRIGMLQNRSNLDQFKHLWRGGWVGRPHWCSFGRWWSSPSSAWASKHRVVWTFSC